MADLNTDQEFTGVTLTITDARDRPAAIDGAPVWASSDETVVVVTTTHDGMTALISSVAPGTARVSVSVDADLGEGVVTVTGVTEDIVVTQAPAGPATTLTLSLGTATDKP